METSEINVFTIDANGFKTHWKIRQDASKEELANLYNRQQQLSDWLASKGYKPDDFGRGAVIASTAPPAAAPASTTAGGEAEWVVNPDGTKSCSVHGQAAFKPGGVSRNTGLPYTGFWKCAVAGCKPKGAN